MNGKRGNSATFFVVTALLAAGFLALLVVGWGYYLTPRPQRAASDLHRLFASAGSLGLGAGLLAFGLFVFNLLYLLRKYLAARAAWVSDGTLRRWLNWHMASGLAGGLYTACHATLQVRSEVTTVAVIALAVVVVTGAAGRFLLRLSPRARAGEDLDLTDLRAGVDALVSEVGSLPEGTQDAAARLSAWSARPVIGDAAPWQAEEELLMIRRDLTPLLIASDPEQPVHHLGELVEHQLRRARSASRGSLLFDLWRPVHRVVAIVFALAAVVHVVWALQEGYLWR